MVPVQKNCPVISIANNLSYPNGIARKSDGNVLVADQNHNLIRILSPQKDGSYKNDIYSGSSNSGMRNGTLKEALFYFIGNIVLDKEENLYVSDSWNHCVRMICGNDVTTFLPKTFRMKNNEECTIRENRAMTIDRTMEHLYLVDSPGRLYKIQLPSAKCVRVYNMGGIGGLPRGIALDNDNNFYYTTTSEVAKAVNFDFTNPQTVCKIADPRSLLLDKPCHYLYIGTNTAVFRFHISSRTLVELCKMHWGTGLALDGKGNLLVCEYNTGNVKSVKLGSAVAWSTARIVWIGHMKNEPKNSPFARLPKEIVREILLFCNEYF